MSRLYSKRHYEDIALLISRISDDDERIKFANLLANRFLQDSRQFNCRRFMDACNAKPSHDEPSLVCDNCALQRNATMPEGHIVTYHKGICGLCGEEKDVTEPRDYGNHRKLLKL